MKKYLSAAIFYLMVEPVSAHSGHGVEYSIGYLLLLVGILYLLAKVFKNS